MGEVRLGKLSKRVFYANIREFEKDAELRSKSALKSTLRYFQDMYREIARKHIYRMYTRKWYDRTYWIRDEDDAIEIYIYKNTKDAISGGVRFNREAYERNNEPFQHGNPTRHLPLESYLAIMNDSEKLHENPYHFPTSKEIDRGHFYDEFLDLVDEKFSEVYDFYWENYGTGRKYGVTYAKSSPAGATSSSTSQYKSIDSGNLNLS